MLGKGDGGLFGNDQSQTTCQCNEGKCVGGGGRDDLKDCSEWADTAASRQMLPMIWPRKRYLVPCYADFLREQFRGFQDLLRHMSILLRRNSISMASLTKRSMYRILVARMKVLWNWMRRLESKPCSATAELSWYSNWMSMTPWYSIWLHFNLLLNTHAHNNAIGDDLNQSSGNSLQRQTFHFL
jgi:hypothetical protein